MLADGVYELVEPAAEWELSQQPRAQADQGLHCCAEEPAAQQGKHRACPSFQIQSSPLFIGCALEFIEVEMEP